MVAVVKSKKGNKPSTKKKTQDLLIKGGIKKKKRSNAVKDVVKSLENKGSEILKTESVKLCKTLSSSPNEKKVVKKIALVTENISSQSPAAKEMSAFWKKTENCADVSLKSNKRGKIKGQASKSTDSGKELKQSPKTRVSFTTKRNIANEKEIGASKKVKSVSKGGNLQKQTEAIESPKLKRKRVKKSRVQKLNVPYKNKRLIHLERLKRNMMKKITRKIIQEYCKVPESSIGELIQIALKVENEDKIALKVENEDKDSNIETSGLRNLIERVVEEYHVVSHSERKPDIKTLIKNVIAFDRENNVAKEINDVSICFKQVRKVLEALFTLLKKKNHKSKKSGDLLFDEPQDIFVEIACMKIPKLPTRVIRVLLPHCPLSDLREVCIIVPDLKKGKRRNHEPTIQHFEEIFREQNVNNISQIVPFCQLKTEYEQYEMRIALCNRFDAFLVGSTISGHVTKCLGKHFVARRKFPTPVSLSRKNLSAKINKALHKTSFRVTNASSTLSAKIGHSKMTLKELYDNILAFCYKLPEVFPGGWLNIACLRVRGAKTSSLPFYISEVESSSVKVPIVKPRRPKAYAAVEDELDYFGRVLVKPDGSVIELEKVENDLFETCEKSKETWNKQQNLSLGKVENVNLDNNNGEDEDVSAFRHRLLQQLESEEFKEPEYRKNKKRKLKEIERMYLGERALNEQVEAEEAQKKLAEMNFFLKRQREENKKQKNSN